MNDEIAPPKPAPKKRRSAAELRAFYTAKVKETEEREKADVLRLLSDAHDTLGEAMSLEASKPHAPAFNQAMTILKNLITAYTPPKK